MTNEPRWWVGIDNRPHGPWTAAEITSALSEKRFSITALVCPVGGERWLILQDIPELAPQAPTESKGFSAPIAKPSDVPHASPSAKEISTSTACQGEQMKSAIWYVLREGKSTGPFTAAEVKEQMRDGQILPIDDVGNGNGEWQNARLWDELTSLPEKYGPGPENQHAFRDDSTKYPAPQPVPTSTNDTAQSATETGWGQWIIAFIAMGFALSYFLQQNEANQKNKFFNKPIQKQQPAKP